MTDIQNTIFIKNICDNMQLNLKKQDMLAIKRDISQYCCIYQSEKYRISSLQAQNDCEIMTTGALDKVYLLQ